MRYARFKNIEEKLRFINLKNREILPMHNFLYIDNIINAHTGE